MLEEGAITLVGDFLFLFKDLFPSFDERLLTGEPPLNFLEESNRGIEDELADKLPIAESLRDKFIRTPSRPILGTLVDKPLEDNLPLKESLSDEDSLPEEGIKRGVLVLLLLFI